MAGEADTWSLDEVPPPSDTWSVTDSIGVEAIGHYLPADDVSWDFDKPAAVVPPGEVMSLRSTVGCTSGASLASAQRVRRGSDAQ